MIQIERFLTTAIVAVATGCAVIPLLAQDSKPAEKAAEKAAADTDAAPAALSIEGMEADLKALESNASIEDTVKASLRGQYKLAIEDLKQAESNKAKETEYQDALKTVADETENLRKELLELPTVEEAARVDVTGTTEELQRKVTSRQADLSGLNDELSKAKSGLTRVKARPAEISGRIPEAQSELAEIKSKLASPDLAKDVTSAGRVAQRIALQATEIKLQTELAMLKQEQLSQSAREEFLQAQNDLLSRQVENATAGLKKLQEAAHQRLEKEARQVESVIKISKEDLPAGDEQAQGLADEVLGLAKEFDAVVVNLKQVSAADQAVKDRLTKLDREYDSLQGELQGDGGGGAIAQLLFDMQDQLLDPNIFGTVSAAGLSTLEQARLAFLQVQQKLRHEEEVEKEFSDRSSEAVTQLLATRGEVLEKLRVQYRSLIPALTALEGDNRQLRVQVGQVRKYVKEQLVWVRSSPPIKVADFLETPAGFRWLFSRQHWQEAGLAVKGVTQRSPLRCATIVLIVIGLLVTRRRIIPALERTGIAIRRISTDRYALTGEAFAYTVLLALPLPMLVGFLTWAMDRYVRHEPEHSAWSRGLTDGLRDGVWITLLLAFSAALCRSGGLADAHFGFRHETLARIRKAIIWFAVAYVPTMLIASSTLYGDASIYSDTVGRVSFLFTHAWTAMLLWGHFSGPDGILATLTNEFPNRLLTRLRYLWYPLLLACPLGLGVLAWRGYFISSIELSVGLVATLGLIVGADVLYYLLLRWFWIKKRNLELAERLEKWRARQEAEETESTDEAGGLLQIDPDEEAELDLESVSEQTRSLVRFLFILGTLAGIVALWNGMVPVLSILSSISVGGDLSLLELARAIIIVIMTWMGVKNLPGVLELSVLRGTSFEAGTRFAITTLCQYALTAVGVVAFAAAIDLDWSQFGWIAAALSVGLGFGLQEVVANFVCGLILLFERPIRVGDVVTVDGTTGTVTRIQMRATTITNWDRQDFVVPNKNLITGTILNWTLTASVNRVVIPVGVAYGTDTDEARRILLDVATKHPLIMDEPAPLATFEQFADSSLTLILRAYLPNLDNRLGAITELHTEIDRRFTEAGIEIAFPQQDLHIRSGLETLAAEKQGVASGGPFEH